jgi:hypothetical protein
MMLGLVLRTMYSFGRLISDLRLDRARPLITLIHASIPQLFIYVAHSFIIKVSLVCHERP